MAEVVSAYLLKFLQGLLKLKMVDQPGFESKYLLLLNHDQDVIFQMNVNTIVLGSSTRADNIGDDFKHMQSLGMKSRTSRRTCRRTWMQNLKLRVVCMTCRMRRQV